MEIQDVKALAEKAKAGAEEGLKKAGNAARQAASDINDGLDSARVALKRQSLTKEAVKTIWDCIHDLEKENKAITKDVIKNDTEIIIEQLKGIVMVLKDEPENSGVQIETLINEFNDRKKELLKEGINEESLMKVQIMSRRYDSAISSCEHAKSVLIAALEESANE